MPTYDYVCSSCEHELEIFQSISASPKRKCPECGRNTLKRQIGAGAGVIFKGSGFYETDYRSSEYKKQAKADQDASKGDSKDSKKSGDSKSSKKESKSSSSSDSSTKSSGKSSKND